MLATIRCRSLSSHLPFKNLRIKIYKTVIEPELMVLRRIFGPKRDEVIG
jgi:hypothetical protein